MILAIDMNLSNTVLKVMRTSGESAGAIARKTLTMKDTLALTDTIDYSARVEKMYPYDG